MTFKQFVFQRLNGLVLLAVVVLSIASFDIGAQPLTPQSLVNKIVAEGIVPIEYANLILARQILDTHNSSETLSRLKYASRMIENIISGEGSATLYKKLWTETLSNVTGNLAMWIKILEFSNNLVRQQPAAEITAFALYPTFRTQNLRDSASNSLISLN